MPSTIRSPRQLAPAKVKLPEATTTTIIPDNDHGNRLTIIHDNGKTTFLEDPKKMTRSGKDVNGVFTIISFYDDNNTLRKQSVLSKSGTHINPDVYDVRTVSYFNSAGIQEHQETYTLSYDIDGDYIGEVLD